MNFNRGEHFQSKHSQQIWNRIGNFNSSPKDDRINKRGIRYWSWGQVAGKAVAEFNKTVRKPVCNSEHI